MDKTISPMRGIINIQEKQVISGRLWVNRKYSILLTGSGGAVTKTLPTSCEQCSQLRLYSVPPTGSELPLNLEYVFSLDVLRQKHSHIM